ncbi:MAG TPA: UDP-glucose 4-epimerase GalE [Parvularculaceae bacterium]|nr:UDP-glucose 4-epimerase GalE [Amphiplicatus sp.]MCB9954517.1 UDP-glucose 4-epimerase GalE [Caulobacterales bacterium]HOP18623.1 UDP-glucose 4-epimerase GalE [Amphiplicatus sp.]HPE31050.1 UDP-glucose 4-epimerase GalE [Parvularculaceae bacterium]HRX38591.1 UDP-glucose 4-epimerase GalE [Parvularculaceae bacterium]
MADRIIVTGGAGYIGSHVCVDLLSAGKSLLIIDDFSNSSPEAVRRIQELAEGDIRLLKSDLADPAQRERIIDAARDFRAQGAIHLAGLKAVGESVTEPERYYRVNLGSALTLIDALKATGGKLIVFSSSATVYGDRNKSPVDETGLLGPTNPYGRTKYFIEEMLRDLHVSDPGWKIANLRYFNPVGAHPSGRIGEDPNGVPNNLFPYIAQVAVGRREKLRVFGDDYDTRDGTGVRDFIHVCDLARGHRAALDHLAREKAPGVVDVNLGTGLGYSVLEAVAAFKRASNRDIPYEIAPRREGDIAEIYANPSKAKALLGWTAEKSLDDMCADHWRWQRENPTGYGE